VVLKEGDVRKFKIACCYGAISFTRLYHPTPAARTTPNQLL
jgi:hypothetical protein